MPKSQSVRNGQRLKTSKARSQASPRARNRKNDAGAGRTPKHRAQFDDLLGQGVDLWNDEEFERFQVWLRQTRSRRE